jgi:hypothetical protein
MNIKAAYFLITAMIGLTIMIAVFSMIQEPRAQFEANIAKPGIISLEKPEPQVTAIGTNDCVLTSIPSAVARQPETQGDRIWSCTYKPNITNLILGSANATDELAIAVSYKDESVIVPCHKVIASMGTSAYAAGPCVIDEQTNGKYQAVFDLYPEIMGSVIMGKSAIVPPTINASSSLSLGVYGTILYNDQRIILGNYSFDITVRPQHTFGLFEFQKDTEVDIKCGTETKIVELSDGESTYLVMCGHGVSIQVKSMCPLQNRCASFAISVEPTTGNVKGDPIFISFWRYDFDFWDNRCGGVQGSEYVTQMAFDIEAAFAMPKCSESFMGGYELNAPVSLSSSVWIG